MYVIGIDPHKATHTAAVLAGDEKVQDEVRVVAGHRQRDELLTFAAPYTPRLWAIESATGWGALLAQQLVAAGEQVLDVPPALSARARLLAGTDKTDRHDARSAAVVALRHDQLRPVTVVDHPVVLRLLADRHHDLTAQRTRVICRVHGLLCLLIAGGRPRSLQAAAARAALRSVETTNDVGFERKAMAHQLLADVDRLDEQLDDIEARIARAVTASGTSVTNVYGIGPITAAIIVGRVGDIARFPTAGHFARYNGTAPIETSSGARVRHRLNRRGDRRLNHALHIAAITQLRNDTPGRVYYDKKLTEGKSRREALRALKRRISDAVYRQLLTDTRP
jgi:transposase